MRLAEPCPVRRVKAGEDSVEVVGVNLAAQIECCTAGDPASGRFAADVIVLHALGDGFEVVRLLALSELADAQHGGRSGERILDT